MSNKNNNTNNLFKVVAQNKKARFNYEILETLEAGIVLLGTEVKSLRKGNMSLQEGYIEVDGNELFLINTHIAEYSFFGQNSHEPTRRRKLLLQRKQISKLTEKVKLKGTTIVPLKLYFNNRGIAKLEIALAKGKNLYDKRSTIKEKEAKKDAEKALKMYRKTSI